jgi:hypothetical protein
MKNDALVCSAIIYTYKVFWVSIMMMMIMMIIYICIAIMTNIQSSSSSFHPVSIKQRVLEKKKANIKWSSWENWPGKIVNIAVTCMGSSPDKFLSVLFPPWRRF